MVAQTQITEEEWVAAQKVRRAREDAEIAARKAAREARAAAPVTAPRRAPRRGYRDAVWMMDHVWDSEDTR